NAGELFAKDEAIKIQLKPTNLRLGRRRIAVRLNLRAARRAPSLPPQMLSLNIFVTTFFPRRKCTWKPWVCFFARAFVSIRRRFASESGLGRLRMSRR